MIITTMAVQMLLTGIKTFMASVQLRYILPGQNCTFAELVEVSKGRFIIQPQILSEYSRRDPGI
jgi:hypothetical protein